MIDATRNKSKLRIIENEFKRAEQNEYKLQEEEEDVRKAVRQKKINEYVGSRRMERVLRIQNDRHVRNEVNSAVEEGLSLIQFDNSPSR